MKPILATPSRAGWAGLFGGALAWYGAHQIGFYFTDLDCRQGWIVIAVHVFALALTIAAGLVSLRSWRTCRPAESFGIGSFSAFIGMAAASLFVLVILWQGAAALVYSGCMR